MSHFINPISTSPIPQTKVEDIELVTGVNSRTYAIRFYEQNKALRPQTANRAFKKRSVIRIDKEQLYEENISLKKQSNLMNSDITKLKARICHLEAELNKLLKESLDRDYKNPKSVVKEMKIKYLDLKRELEVKNAENLDLKKNLKNSKIQEIESENQALNQECIRLKRLIQDVNQGKPANKKEVLLPKPGGAYKSQRDSSLLKRKEKTHLIKKLHARINDLEKYLKRSYDGAAFKKFINDDIALSKDFEQVRLQLENEIKRKTEEISDLAWKMEEWKKKAEEIDKKLSEKNREMREMKEFVEKNINYRRRFPPKLFRILNFLVYKENITVEKLLLSLFMNELVTLDHFYEKTKELYPKMKKNAISDVKGFISKENKISLKKLQDWFNQFIYELDEELSEDESSENFEILSTRKEIYTQTEDVESVKSSEKSSQDSNKTTQSVNLLTSKLANSKNPSEKILPFTDTLELELNQTSKDEGLNLDFMIEKESPQFASPPKPEPVAPHSQTSITAGDDEQLLKFEMISSPVLPQQSSSLTLPQKPEASSIIPGPDKPFPPASNKIPDAVKPNPILDTLTTTSIKPLQSPSNSSQKPNENLQRLLKHFLFKLQINNIPLGQVVPHLFPGTPSSHLLNPSDFELKLQSNSFSFPDRDSRTLSNFFFNHQAISQASFDDKILEVFEDWEVLQPNETLQAEEELFKFFSLSAGKIDKELRELDKGSKGFVSFKQFFMSLEKSRIDFPVKILNYFQLECYKIDYQLERVPYVVLLERFINMEKSKEKANEIKDRTIEHYIKALADRVVRNNIQPKILFGSNEFGMISPDNFIQGLHKIGFGDVSHEDLNILIDELSSAKSEEHFIKLSTLESLIRLYGNSKSRYFEEKKKNESIDIGKISELDSFDFESFTNTPLDKAYDLVLK